MLIPLSQLPQGLLGFRAQGTVNADDYRQILAPAIEQHLQSHSGCRLLYILDDEFSGYTAGALWADAELGFSHWRAWQKVAIVSDHPHLNTVIEHLQFLMPCPVKIFLSEQEQDAIEWLNLE